MDNSSLENYQQEVQNIKNNRKKQVVKIAKQFFFEKGIELTTFNDIAEKASIGVSTVYRYFKNKNDLVIAAAELAVLDYIQWETKKLKTMPLNGTGKDKLKALFSIFLELYSNEPQYILFLGDFDNYIQKEKIPKNKLTFYDQSLQSSMKFYYEAFEQGFKDGSIKKNIDAKLYIVTTSLSLRTLAQKLLLNGDIIETDKYLRDSDHIKCLIDMFIETL